VERNRCGLVPCVWLCGLGLQPTGVPAVRDIYIGVSKRLTPTRIPAYPPLSYIRPSAESGISALHPLDPAIWEPKPHAANNGYGRPMWLLSRTGLHRLTAATVSKEEDEKTNTSPRPTESRSATERRHTRSPRLPIDGPLRLSAYLSDTSVRCVKDMVTLTYTGEISKEFAMQNKPACYETGPQICMYLDRRPGHGSRTHWRAGNMQIASKKSVGRSSCQNVNHVSSLRSPRVAGRLRFVGYNQRVSPVLGFVLPWCPRLPSCLTPRSRLSTHCP
jgi:hypothetical protein